MTYTYENLGNWGRLGNQMWQLASTIGIAVANNDKASFPDWKYREYFSVPDIYFTNEQGIDGGQDYLQDLKYFKDIVPLIKSYFKPSQMVEDYIENKYGNIFKWGTLNERVAVHVRRGDYVNLPLHHPVCSADWYKKAINDSLGCFRASDFKSLVTVFSDDIEWCRRQEVFDGATFIEGNNEAVDLHLMSKCFTQIISNSTFSWWSAWLGDRCTPAIYPKPWYGEALQHIDVENTMILPGWIGIDR